MGSTGAVFTLVLLVVVLLAPRGAEVAHQPARRPGNEGEGPQRRPFRRCIFVAQRRLRRVGQRASDPDFPAGPGLPREREVPCPGPGFHDILGVPERPGRSETDLNVGYARPALAFVQLHDERRFQHPRDTHRGRQQHPARAVPVEKAAGADSARAGRGERRDIELEQRVVHPPGASRKRVEG